MRRLLFAAHLYLLAVPLLLNIIGASLNQIVLIANHDKFPVMVNARNAEKHGNVDDEGMLDDIHCLMTPHTHLNFLADIFDFKGEGIESPGDILIDLGEYISPYAYFAWSLLMIGTVLRKVQA